MYLWLKFLHIFFIISWFAGLFYLPRIFVNLAMTSPDTAEHTRLVVMAKKLYAFMTPLGVLAVLFGLSIPFVTGWWGQGWVHVKTLLGLLLAFYHLYCGALLQAFKKNQNRHTHKWYRVFNEIPVFIMLAAVYLVIFKPF